MEDGESGFSPLKLAFGCRVTLTSGCRYIWATGTFSNNATILAKVNELAQAKFSNLMTKNGNFTFSNVFQPIPRSIVSSYFSHQIFSSG